MATVTLANLYNGVQDDKRTVEADVTMNASYTTGGDTLPLAALGLTAVSAAHVMTAASAGRPGTVAFNPHGIQLQLVGTSTAPLLKAFSGATTEVASTTNLSARGAIRVRFYGTD